MPDKNRITKTGPTPIISGTNAGGASDSKNSSNSGSSGKTSSPSGMNTPSSQTTSTNPTDSNNAASTNNSNQKTDGAARSNSANNSGNNPSSADNKATIAEIISSIEGSENILIALGANPSVDELAAAIGFYLYLDRSGKHATVVYSGAIPRSLEYLHPEEIFEKTTDTLQDLVISLDKEKADHLRYKLEGDFVKIYITPYRSKVSSKDLVYSYGDYNVDLAILLKAESENNLDPALKDSAQIFKEAAVVNITNDAPAKIGQIEWSNQRASSISEMVAELMIEFKTDVKMNAEEATALLTGIIFVTDHFSNRSATSKTLQVASRLMEAGGNQQVVSTNLELDKIAAPIIKTPAPEKKPVDEGLQDLNQGVLGAGGSVAGRLEIKRATSEEAEKVEKSESAARLQKMADTPKSPSEKPESATEGTLEKTELSSVSEPASKEVTDNPETKKDLEGEKDKPKDAPASPKDTLRSSPSRPGATSFATAETLANTSLEPWGKGPAEEEYKELNADLSAAASSLVSNAGVETVPEEKPVLQIDEDKTLPPNELAGKIEDELADKPEVVIQPPSGFGEDNGSSKFGQMLAEAISGPTPGAMPGSFGATSSGIGATSSPSSFGPAGSSSSFGATSGFGATPGATTFGATSTIPLTPLSNPATTSSTTASPASSPSLATNPSPMPVVAALPVPEKPTPAPAASGNVTGFPSNPSPLPTTSPAPTTPVEPALGAITPLSKSPALSSAPNSAIPPLPTASPLNSPSDINGTPLPNPLENDADLLPPPPVPPVDLSSVMPTSPDVVDPSHAVPPLTPPAGGFGGVPFGPPADLGVITTNHAPSLSAPSQGATAPSAPAVASAAPTDPGAFKIPGM